ncbi:MAG: hypothetical protein JXR66_01460 [Bacteroidales bacterium]|nr:hypothetical protein [Bacteroidales bacterium]MBN2632193.1 hypothetical protein [Bacteroidales bacterium]
MKQLLKKLNYKSQPRIAVLNSEEQFLKAMKEELGDVITDTEIDQRCPYSFIIVFAEKEKEVEAITPVVLHNLTADGILWFCYPKKTSKKNRSDLERDRGWKSLNETGFYGVRMVSVDDDWSAIRFRNIRFIKSTSGRYPKN